MNARRWEDVRAEAIASGRIDVARAEANLSILRGMVEALAGKTIRRDDLLEDDE